MVSYMESTDPARQLADIDRLQTRTESESLQGRRGAMPVLIVGTLLFFSSFEIDSRWVRILAPVAWTVFIVAWVRWLRSSNRARPGWRLASFEWRRYLPWWIALTLVANLIALLGEKVSWIWAGVLMAALVGGGGPIVSRLTRR
jgi:hypothetical protein